MRRYLILAVCINHGVDERLAGYKGNRFDINSPLEFFLSCCEFLKYVELILLGFLLPK